MTQASVNITQQFKDGGVVPATLTGQNAASKTYVDQQLAIRDANISAAAGAANAAQADIDAHEASTTAHPAQNITYTGLVAGAANVKQGLDNLYTRVNDIIADGDSSAEVVDARGGYPVLGDRLNATDAQLADFAINVKSYGAVGDGVTDDTDAINAAIQAAANAVLYFPPGTYSISGSLVVDKIITITGAAPELTIISTSSPVDDVFVVTQWKSRIKNLSITSSVTRTSGYGINHGSGSSFSAINVGMSNMYNGLNLSGTLDVANFITIRDFANNGIEISGGTDQKLLNIVMDNTVAPAGSGILIKKTGALFLDNCDIIRSNIDMQIAPGANQSVFAVYATNCYFDTATHGLLIGGSSPVERVKFINCWFSSHSADGIRLNNSAAKAIDFVNCDIYGNSGHGINSSFANDWGVSLSRIAGNGGSGVNLAASSKKVRIINNFISPTGGWNGNAYAIWINSGTYDHYEVRGNVVYGNISGTIVDSGSATYKRIMDNVGYNPRGNISAPTMPASGTAYTNDFGNDARVIITGGTVTDIKIGSTSTGLTSGQFIVGPGESITLTYSAAPTWRWFVM